MGGRTSYSLPISRLMVWILIRIQTFHSRKRVCKCHPQNVVYFVSVSIHEWRMSCIVCLTKWQVANINYMSTHMPPIHFCISYCGFSKIPQGALIHSMGWLGQYINETIIAKQIRLILRNIHIQHCSFRAIWCIPAINSAKATWL